VIKLDPVEKKINLSLKHFSPDPWSVFEQRYQVGDVVKGRVTKLTDFGAFIEIEEGIEGLAHISEFSWVKRIKHPKEVLNIGDEVEVMILGYDLSQGKVSLGLKQVCQNPWDSIDQTYPVGTRLTRPVVKVTNAGAFVQLEEGIDGFLHVDDMSWTKKIKNPSSVLNPGDEVEVIVVDCDVENHRIQLGMKQLSDDPWESLYNTYPRGSIIEGEISNITDFGMFVRVPGDIEGLINKHNVAESLNPSGDEIPCSLQGRRQDQGSGDGDQPEGAAPFPFHPRIPEGYPARGALEIHHDEEEESTVTLGDLLKNKGMIR
jgi:small subunit ribosomal protein S1